MLGGWPKSVLFQTFSTLCWAACITCQPQPPGGQPVYSSLKYQSDRPPKDFGSFQFNLSRLCAPNSAQLHLTVTQTQVPTSMSMNRGGASTTSAFAIHAWTTVLLDSNSSIPANAPNGAQLYLLNDIMYLNLADGSLAYGDPGVFLSAPIPGNPPVLDMDANNKRGQVIQSPQVLSYSGITGSQGPAALTFKTFVTAPTASTDSNTIDVYVETLSRLWYVIAQIALGNGICSSGYQSLGDTLNYVQSIMANVSRSDLEMAGIPDDIMFVPSQKANASCLQEPGASYKGTVAVKGASNSAQNSSQCCQQCQDYSSAAGPTQIGCNAWVYCSNPQGCDLMVNSTTAATGAEATLPYKGCQLLADDGAISYNADAQLYARDLDDSLISGRTTPIQPLNQNLPSGSDYPMGALKPGTVGPPISLAALTPSGSISYRRRLQSTPC